MSTTSNSTCILCGDKAEHNLGYRDLRGKVAWYGDYCTNCFVQKLRGMVSVWNSRIKKQCKKCGNDLKDKRMKVCDDCQGMVFKDDTSLHNSEGI